MSNEQDYKMAYEALSRAVGEAVRILAATQIRTAAGLRMADGENLDDLDKELLNLMERLGR